MMNWAANLWCNTHQSCILFYLARSRGWNSGVCHRKQSYRGSSLTTNASFQCRKWGSFLYHRSSTLSQYLVIAEQEWRRLLHLPRRVPSCQRISLETFSYSWESASTLPDLGKITSAINLYLRTRFVCCLQCVPLSGWQLLCLCCSSSCQQLGHSSYSESLMRDFLHRSRVKYFLSGSAVCLAFLSHSGKRLVM